MNQNTNDKATCCRCKKLKAVTELNGYNPITKDYSKVYCRKLSECDSKEARAKLDKIARSL